MDINRLSQGEKIAAGSGIALFIIMFLKWFGFEETNIASLSGWDLDLIRFALLLAIIAAVGAAAAKASGNDLNLPVPASVLVAGLGALAALLVLFRLVSTPDFDFGGVDVAETTRSYGVFLALIAAGGITYGGYVQMQDEGTSFQEAADQVRDRGDGPGASPPPPPPPPPPSPPPAQ